MAIKAFIRFCHPTWVVPLGCDEGFSEMKRRHKAKERKWPRGWRLLSARDYWL